MSVPQFYLRSLALKEQSLEIAGQPVVIPKFELPGSSASRHSRETFKKEADRWFYEQVVPVAGKALVESSLSKSERDQALSKLQAKLNRQLNYSAILQRRKDGLASKPTGDYKKRTAPTPVQNIISDTILENTKKIVDTAAQIKKDQADKKIPAYKESISLFFSIATKAQSHDPASGNIGNLFVSIRELPTPKAHIWPTSFMNAHKVQSKWEAFEAFLEEETHLNDSPLSREEKAVRSLFLFNELRLISSGKMHFRDARLSSPISRKILTKNEFNFIEGVLIALIAYYSALLIPLLPYFKEVAPHIHKKELLIAYVKHNVMPFIYEGAKGHPEGSVPLRSALFNALWEMDYNNHPLLLLKPSTPSYRRRLESLTKKANETFSDASKLAATQELHDYLNQFFANYEVAASEQNLKATTAPISGAFSPSSSTPIRSTSSGSLAMFFIENFNISDSTPVSPTTAPSYSPT